MSSKSYLPLMSDGDIGVYVPDVADVRTGTIYGANGTELTGTLIAGGTTSTDPGIENVLEGVSYIINDIVLMGTLELQVITPALSYSGFRKAVTILRATEKGRWENGHYLPSNTVEELTIQASVQPYLGKKLESLSEGRRNKQILSLYTDTELLVHDSTTNTVADIVKLNGMNFEVICCEAFLGGVINHYEVTVVRIEQ